MCAKINSQIVIFVENSVDIVDYFLTNVMIFGLHFQKIRLQLIAGLEAMRNNAMFRRRKLFTIINLTS